MSTISIVPTYYDTDWLANELGIRFIGVSEKDDGIHLHYENSHFEALSEAIDSYPVDYLAVALPAKKAAIVALRKEKVKIFAFGGLTLELDYITESRLSGASLYLMRNEGVASINWDIGTGTFVNIPRANILALADAAGAYVQACFNYSKDLVEACESAADIIELAEIDIEAGWPT